MGIWTLGPPKSKWHLDPFSVFAGLTILTENQQTDIPTDRPRYSIYNNRPHLHMQYYDAA